MKRYIILVFSTRTILSLSYFRKRNLVGSPSEDPFQSPSENPFKLRIFHAPFSFQLLIRSNKKIASGELGILPPVFPFEFLIKSDKEIAAGASGSSGRLFLDIFLSGAVRKSMLRAQDLPSPHLRPTSYEEQWENHCWELGILPLLFSYTFLIKSNKEIAPESSGSSLPPFPCKFLFKTVRELLRNPPEPLVSLFPIVSY